jgi:hypothetical protein
MSDKRGSAGGKALGAVASFAATHVSRKLISVAWKKATGKEPPSDPQDPTVGLGEALGWAILAGVVVETARVLAVRTAARRMRRLD